MKAKNNFLVGDEKGVQYSAPSILSVNDLLNNQTAITILLSQIKSGETEINELKNKLEKTSQKIPAGSFLICLSVMNFLGTVLIGFTTNLLTNSNGGNSIYWLIFGIGAIFVITGIICNIDYVRINKWYNKITSKT